MPIRERAFTATLCYRIGMPICDCCHVVIHDLDAVTITLQRRTVRLCRDHSRLVIAVLEDLQIEPPIITY